MNIAELAKEVQFKKGRFIVEAVSGRIAHPILHLSFNGNDEDGARHLPSVQVHPDASEAHRPALANALIRAGARHPGLRDEDLAKVHKAARSAGHVELFVDINALCHGLVGQLTMSLGRRLARIVMSSSTVDVLHEYQSAARRHHDGSKSVVTAWELARGMRLLNELRVPVHVHQLAPGAARYFRRPQADGSLVTSNETRELRDETTYVAEDRQMVAAFWDYRAMASPRIPLFLVTEDFALAHVCAAERVPFVFAKAPRETADFAPETLWFDPYALGFRTCMAQTILWELSVVFGTLNVRRLGDGPAGGGTPDATRPAGATGAAAGPAGPAAPLGVGATEATGVVGPAGPPGTQPMVAMSESFSLEYRARDHWPGEGEDVVRGELVQPSPPPASAGAQAAPPRKLERRLLKLSLNPVIEVLPTHPGQRVPFAQFKPKDEDSVRQLWQIGAETGLFRQDGTDVVAGEGLALLLAALDAADYIAVNRLFRRVPGYNRVLDEAEELGLFPNSKKGGAATGWAVILGAAYKLPAETRFGLREATEEQFERAIVRCHQEIGRSESAVLLHRVLDRVCAELGLSPVRFETLLNRCLGQRGLRDFEAQRVTSKGPIPAHDVLTAPTTSSSKSYLRRIAPGEGITVGNKLVASLVRRGVR